MGVGRSGTTRKAPRTAVVARVAAGAVCLLLGPARSSHDRGARHAHAAQSDVVTDLAVVLAARYLIQAALIARGHGASLRWRASVETLHASSMAAAAAAAPAHRRAALSALTIALGVLGSDLARRAV